jgi:myo-inositol-1(or 4)-monophosphatase
MIEKTLREIARAVFLEFRSHREVGKIEVKQGLDIVTEADHRLQNRIVEIIKSRHPRHAILAEEGEQQGTGEHLWVIDPIDGTINFAAGNPCPSHTFSGERLFTAASSCRP